MTVGPDWPHFEDVHAAQQADDPEATAQTEAAFHRGIDHRAAQAGHDPGPEPGDVSMWVLADAEGHILHASIGPAREAEAGG